jgi:uncharacterized protein with NAD-binding domain and iron-sulfur cluster
LGSESLEEELSKKTVAILGGGVGGLSAAHELLERGFEVTIYERHPILGGKARSHPKSGTGKDGRRDLPGEHGFRMLPGFFKHLPDTMKRIPFGGNNNGVLDNLVETTRTMITSLGVKRPLELPSVMTARSISDVRAMVRALLEADDFEIQPSDTLFFIGRLLAIFGACDERRYDELDQISWWDFSGAAERSKNYQRYYAIGSTRTMVACRAEQVSARTGGVIGAQLALSSFMPGSFPDRLLNGPTNEVWFRPWLEYLRSLGLKYLTRRLACGIKCDGNRVTSVTILNLDSNEKEEIPADFYVAAVPVEVMEALARGNDPLSTAEPKFADLHMLRTARVNGIQFYLRRDVPVVAGHAIYLDSSWALTSVSQQQFWRVSIAQEYGDGTVGGILSVNISDWDTPCPCHDRCANNCSPDEIAMEVWSQLKAHLNRGEVLVDDANLAGYYLDRDVRPCRKSSLSLDVDLDLEPLLINTAGSWKYRPQAATGISNLFLASDYVQTHTDLACMEGANEAARRAVNAILDTSGVTAPKCSVWPLAEPTVFRSLREWDKRTYKAGYDGMLDGPPGLLFTAALGELLDFGNALGRSVASMLPPFLRELTKRI